MRHKLYKKTSNGTELWTDFDLDVWIGDEDEDKNEVLLVQSEIEEVIQFLIEAKADYEAMIMKKL